MNETHSRALAASATAAILLVAVAVVDHALFGVLPVGRATFGIAGNAAFAGALLLIPLLPATLVLFAPISRFFETRQRIAWAGALFLLMAALGEAAWSLGVYAVLWDGPPIDRRHLLGYGFGLLPVLIGSTLLARRTARKPVPRWGWLLVTLAFTAFFLGTVAWLYPIYPAGATTHLVYNSTAAGLVLSLVALSAALVSGARPRRWHRASIPALAAIMLAAVEFRSAYISSFETRDAAARGGRLSRTLLRFTQFAYSPEGHGLHELASRAKPPRSGKSADGFEEPMAALRAAAPTGFVILTIDATRFDALAGTQPLARLASEALTFEQHHSPAPGTRESMTTMFTGSWFWTKESEEGPNLFTRFHERGFRTIVVGYASGSNQYVHNDAMRRSIDELVERPAMTENPHASFITDSLLAKLSDVGERPFLAWGHYLDPHFPYDDGVGSRRQRYQQEVDRTATEIVRLVDTLAQRGLLERTAVIVTADHGEEFGEHGSGYHNLTLYEEVLHVPLLVRFPKASRQGKVQVPTSGRDLSTAILRAAGSDVVQSKKSESIFAFTAVAPGASPPVGVASVLGGRHKLIYDFRLRSAELYDLQADPAEQKNLIDIEPGVAADLAEQLLEELSGNGVELK